MKGLDKLNYPRLAKVLTQEGKIPAEVVADALRECNESGHPFPQIIVRDGMASEWDLVRLISQEFSLPILLPSRYSIEKEVIALVPAEMIRKTQVFPIDRFGNNLAVVMPLLATAQTLEQIASHTKLEVFPYVAPVSEIQKLIADKLPEAPAPIPAEEAKPKAKPAADGWEKLFDEADQAVKKPADGKKS